MNKTSKMIYISLLVAQALVLSLFERFIPVPFVAPGAKLGLANLIVVISLYTLPNLKDSLTVVILKLLLSTLLFGNFSTFLYSLAGGLLSFSAMVIFKKLGGKNISILGVSASGAIFHNVGQLFVAALIINSFSIFIYLPVLSFLGIGTGIIIGITANYAVTHIKKLPFYNKIIA